MSAYDFMREVLKERWDVGVLLIGYDHRFGHNREEGFEDYVRYGQEIGIQVLQAQGGGGGQGDDRGREGGGRDGGGKREPPRLLHRLAVQARQESRYAVCLEGLQRRAV